MTEPSEKTKHVKLTAYLPERYRRAVNTSAARRGLTVGDVLVQLIAAHLAQDLALADDSIGQGEGPPKGKPGRKPRSRD